MNFLAVLLIPDGERHDHVLRQLDGRPGDAHDRARLADPLLLNAFVVVVGFLILSGAVNTSIVGSNGVLSRVAEDGVLPDWFLKPHPRLRHELSPAVPDHRAAAVHDRRQPRRRDPAGRGVRLRRRVELRVQHAVDGRAAVQEARAARVSSCRSTSAVGDVYLPIGLSAGVSDRCSSSALANLVTKPMATISGLCFAGAFLTTSSRSPKRSTSGTAAASTTSTSSSSTARRSQRVTAESLGLTQAVPQAGRHPLAAQPVHARQGAGRHRSADDRRRRDDGQGRAARRRHRRRGIALDTYDQQLLTAVVNHAERLGKTVTPLLVPTNNALHAVLNTAKDLPARK